MYSSGFYIGKDDIKRSPLTLTLIGINILLFIILNIFFKFFLHNENPLNWFIQFNSMISQGKEIWSLFTSIFVHADFMHIFFNMLALFVFGLAAEKYYKRWQYLIIYFFSGFCGSIFFFLLLPDYNGLGASGAIYGLMAAIFIKIGTKNPTYFLFALLYLAIRLFDGNYAHLFGILGGLCLGLIFRYFDLRKYVKKNTKDFRKKKRRSFKITKSKTKSPVLSPKFTQFDPTFSTVKFHSGSEYEIYLLQQIRDVLIVNGNLTINRAASLLNMKSLDLLPRLKIWETKLAFHIESDIIFVDNPTQLVLEIDQILDQWEKNKRLD